MRLGIMQPYLFPYLGYFQLMNAVDQYILYDNIQYTKKGWINRNRILLDCKECMFSLPLKKGSDFLDINERLISDDSAKEINRILRQIKSGYSKSPYFEETFSLIESVFLYSDRNLFNYILNSIEAVNRYLGILTPIRKSSEICIDHSLKGKSKVLEFCREMNASAYINPIGGLELYDREEFQRNGISIKFLRMKDITYRQNCETFISGLSVIDVMMFNSKSETVDLLNEYYLI